MKHTIYQVTNLIDNKIYIGKHSTNNINDSYLGSGEYLNRAIKKYGKENFKKEILYIFDTEEESLLKEMEIVNKEFVSRKDTYNVTLGGRGSFFHLKGIPKSEETRKKIGDSFRGIPRPKEIGDKIKASLTGRKRSEETKEKLRKPKSEEHKLKMSINRKNMNLTGERNPFFNKQHSEESKIKIGNRDYSKQSGKTHYLSKTYLLISPKNEEFILYGGEVSKFCKSNKLSESLLRKNINKSVKIKNIHNCKYPNTEGYSLNVMV
jgi:group I intron endonuclease